MKLSFNVLHKFYFWLHVIFLQFLIIFLLLLVKQFFTLKYKLRMNVKCDFCDRNDNLITLEKGIKTFFICQTCREVDRNFYFNTKTKEYLSDDDITSLLQIILKNLKIIQF